MKKTYDVTIDHMVHFVGSKLGLYVSFLIPLYTANDYRQTTDELMFKGVISTQRCIKKLNIVECAINN